MKVLCTACRQNLHAHLWVAFKILLPFPIRWLELEVRNDNTRCWAVLATLMCWFATHDDRLEQSTQSRSVGHSVVTL
jgi:hypothetical protein